MLSEATSLLLLLPNRQPNVKKRSEPFKCCTKKEIAKANPPEYIQSKEIDYQYSKRDFHVGLSISFLYELFALPNSDFSARLVASGIMQELILFTHWSFFLNLWFHVLSRYM